MTEITESILFRQKLYDNFKDSGLLSKIKTSLRANLLEMLQKPQSDAQKNKIDESKTPFHLRSKFIESIITEYLQYSQKEYSLSIFMAECDLSEEDCLKYNELSEVTNLSVPSNNQSFIQRLLAEFVRIRCGVGSQRSTQTDFDEPLSKKLEIIDKEYQPKIDYWKLIPNNKASNLPDSLFQHQQKLKAKFNLEKIQLKNELELQIKKEMQRKYENQYLFRMKQVQKQHQARLTEMKNRQKQLLESLQKKKIALQQKASKINHDELKMINKYELKMKELEAEYLSKVKDIQNKQKEFWKKELELKAKKREYEQTIRLVKQKVINQSIQ